MSPGFYLGVYMEELAAAVCNYLKAIDKKAPRVVEKDAERRVRQALAKYYDLAATLQAAE